MVFYSYNNFYIESTTKAEQDILSLVSCVFVQIMQVKYLNFYMYIAMDQTLKKSCTFFKRPVLTN